MLLPWVQWTLVLLNLSFCRTDNSFLSLVSHLLILALDKTRSLVQVAYIPHQLDFIFRLNLEFLSLGRANPFTLFGVSGFVHAILHHLLFNTPCKPPHSPLFSEFLFVEMTKLFLAPLSPRVPGSHMFCLQSPTGYLTPPQHWHLHPNLLPEQASLLRRNVNLRYHSTLESVLLSSRDSALAVSTQQSGKANVSIFQNFFFKPLKWISGHLKVTLIIWGLPDYDASFSWMTCM